MDKETGETCFMAISRLYLKITEPLEIVITEDEVELFIGSMDRFNLPQRPGPGEPRSN